MLKLALFFVLSMTVGCAESINGKEPTSAPSGMQQAIPGDPAPNTFEGHHTRSAVLERDYGRASDAHVATHHRDPVECWQCRR